MDNTLIEINKHKLNIVNLSNELINTFDLNQEILISNDIKKEADFLLSLLNIKQSAMNNQMSINNNMNLFNPMMNPNFNNNQLQQKFLQQQQILDQQILQQQQIHQQLQQQMNDMNKEKKLYEDFTVIFRQRGEKPIMIQCTVHDKVSDIIEKYKNMAVIRVIHKNLYIMQKL